MRFAKASLLIFSLTALTACSSSDTASPSSGMGTQIDGTFVDAPVAGLNYSSSSSTGTTSSEGVYTCVLGEVVTFTIGNLQLGSAPCSSAIFPMHLTGESSISSTGGAVAMGVLFHALDANASDGVLTIPTTVRNMNFSTTVNFGTFSSTSGLTNFKNMLDEINTDAGLAINSASIQANYASTHAPAVVTELQTSLTNPAYVSLPSNISSYAGKYFLLTGKPSAQSNPLCVGTASLGVGFVSAPVGSGTAYIATAYEVEDSAVDVLSVLGQGLLTNSSLALSSNSTVVPGLPGTINTQVVVTMNSSSLALSGHAKITSSAFSGINCTYDIEGTETTNLVVPSTAVLTISGGPTYNFGSKSSGTSTNATLSVLNSGSAAATSVSGGGLAAPYSFVGGSYPGTGGTCAATVAAGASCTIVVRFSPTSTGSFSDSVLINYTSNSVSAQATRDLDGIGTPPAAVLVISSGPTYNYGGVAVGASPTHTFTVTNTGTIGATSLSETGLAAPFGFVGGSFPGTGGNCGFALPASSSCTMIVAYSPTTVGMQNDTIDLSYNNGSSTQIATRTVVGTGGTPANLTISGGPTYNYGTQATGSNTDYTFTVTNSGNYVATSMAGSGLAAPFNFKGGSYPGTGGTCASFLATTGTCTIVVTFSPSVSGAANDAIDLNYNNGVSAQATSRAIQGTGL